MNLNGRKLEYKQRYLRIQFCLKPEDKKVFKSLFLMLIDVAAKKWRPSFNRLSLLNPIRVEGSSGTHHGERPFIIVLINGEQKSEILFLEFDSSLSIKT